ncbi:DUF6289 family protein [Luteibacter sp. UNCMF366Tsu5.1]|uniref:DUF6289 family protein n=1 Tax=Luteibacter sp. UNCMF366Tsu5.1 TaxID=1502758 RepID=UPI000908AF2E|nr:DUF6289 family protein [Luteibacter sp. UNCMF366Tsu5.1]SFW76094.1 hypothetical protein SAMN02800691_3635 [Luteibacter sp. UNCMF366Tsu5.1]
MKGSLGKLALAAISLFGIVGNAYALSLTSTSIKYFDENGAIVGQFLRTCEAVTYHGGNTHTAYTIYEATPCGSNPSPHYIVPGTIITNYTLPGFLTISAACGPAECEPAGIAEPRLLQDKGWTFTNP